MPRYPTNPRRARATRPAPAPGGRPYIPGRPARPVPGNPANDNPRFPVGNPANDNPPRRPPDEPGAPGSGGRRRGRLRLPLGRLPLIPLVFGAAGLYEGYTRSPYPFPLPAFPPGDMSFWWLANGPNVYSSSAYSANNHRPTTQWRLGYSDRTGNYGPQTSVQSGQAITESARKPLGSPVGASDTQQSYWIENVDQSNFIRFAQYLRWLKYTNPAQWPNLKALGMIQMPLPMEAMPIGPVPIRGPVPIGLPLAPPVIPLKPPVPLADPWPAPRAPLPRSPFNPAHHPPRVPPRGVRERKGRLRQGFDRVMDVFGEITEIADIVDSAWDALPESCRTMTYYRGRVVTSAADRWADVYRCAPHMDIEQFIRNLINNHVQDMVIGWQSRLRNRVLPDGINGIDLFRWIDEAVFGGELLRQLDLSRFIPRI